MCTFLGPEQKNTIWDGTPPPVHQTQSILVQECSDVTNQFKVCFELLYPFCVVDFYSAFQGF